MKITSKFIIRFAIGYLIFIAMLLMICQAVKANEFIKQLEGFKAYKYTCLGGAETIGYGTTTNIKGTLWVSKEGAQKLLENHLNTKVRPAMKEIKVKMNKDMIISTESLVYNIGEGQHAAYKNGKLIRKDTGFRGSTFLVKLNKGDYYGAANEMLRWNKVNGEFNQVLYERREKERALFLQGIKELERNAKMVL